MGYIRWLVGDIKRLVKNVGRQVKECRRLAEDDKLVDYFMGTVDS